MAGAGGRDAAYAWLAHGRWPAHGSHGPRDPPAAHRNSVTPPPARRWRAGVLASNPQRLSPFGHRLVIERSTDEVVGSLGLFWPPSDGRVEIGYGVVPSRQGRGYAVHANV
ncbi:GNAT family N-acetyltransferase [Lentzea albida]|uniref:GNAT family N-acetyltransferase n=1 Tax=Lentzea albida TaxID=65499 RepID=UPI0015A56DBF|nr:GNAT family N-acetyltransferase [Lentzea albida]